MDITSLTERQAVHACTYVYSRHVYCGHLYQCTGSCRCDGDVQTVAYIAVRLYGVRESAPA